MLKNIFKVFFLFLFSFPSFCFGQIIFSEILFDPAGSDAGNEWVEIRNTAKYPVNLEGYKFCEGSPTCHAWAEGKNTDFEIGGESLAIITDDKDKFLESYSFSGLILVSTGFILNNTGELIQIKNPDGELDDFLTYNPETGGQNGETLSVFGDVWRKSEATPGLENIEKVDDVVEEKESEDSPEVIKDTKIKKVKTNTSYMEVSSDMHNGKKKLKAEVDIMGVMMAGSRAKISGKAYGISGVEISGIDFFWNFGDGEKGYGQEVFHEFIFPGEYILSLVVKSGRFTGEDKVRIKIIDPPIEISDVKASDKKSEGYIKIKNNSSEILNIEGWVISVDGDIFEIPEKTFVDKNSEIAFPNRTTDLIPKDKKGEESKIFLRFPNGQNFFSYSFDKEEVFLKPPVVKEEVQKVTEKVPEKVIKKLPEKIKIKLKKKVVRVEKKESDDKSEKVKEIIEKKKPKENIVDNTKENIVFDGEKYFAKKYSLKTDGGFIKDQWPFLTFVFLLGLLIFFVFRVRNSEEGFAETATDQNPPNPEKEKQDYEKELKAKAGEYEIEEILEK